jgi:isocitrate/isopropylmalate dehydrogenase
MRLCGGRRRVRVSTRRRAGALLVDAGDAFATQSARFDVLLAGNMFGDILIDERRCWLDRWAAAIRLLGRAVCVYEPIPGSGPICGRGIANRRHDPSAAMLLRYTLA